MRIYRQPELDRILASLKAAKQLLITSGEGMGKTFLANQVYQALNDEGYAVGWFEPAAPKLLLTEIAELLGVELKSLEGRSLTADGLQKAIAQNLSANPTILIFDNAHSLALSFRQWLKSLKGANVPLLLTATHPPRTDIFFSLPRIELQPLPDYCIRELMEQAAIARGLQLRPSELSKLQERVGGNPALAERAIDEELIGTSVEGGDHGLYFDITPLIAMIGVIFICLRFIGLGTNNQALYIFSGIGAACFMGFTLAVRSLPKESRRIS